MITFEQSMLSHLKKLILLDRDYAEWAIKWYFRTCPWLEQSIGPELREFWTSTRSAATNGPQ